MEMCFVSGLETEQSQNDKSVPATVQELITKQERTVTTGRWGCTRQHSIIPNCTENLPQTELSWPLTCRDPGVALLPCSPLPQQGQPPKEQGWCQPRHHLWGANRNQHVPRSSLPLSGRKGLSKDGTNPREK